MRSSNVYEERSLGIYGKDQVHHGEEAPARAFFKKLMASISVQANNAISPADVHNEPDKGFVRQHARAQFSHEIMLPVLALFLILCIENKHIGLDVENWSVFNIMLEVIAGYGWCKYFPTPVSRLTVKLI